MIKDINSSAAALYDGGWRAADREQLIGEYELTADEAEAICEALAEIESKTTSKRYVLIDWIRNGDIFDEDLGSDLEAAITTARRAWARLSDHDRAERQSFYVGIFTEAETDGLMYDIAEGHDTAVDILAEWEESKQNPESEDWELN